jgi:hypothetical protein
MGHANMEKIQWATPYVGEMVRAAELTGSAGLMEHAGWTAHAAGGMGLVVRMASAGAARLAMITEYAVPRANAGRLPYAIKMELAVRMGTAGE